MHHLGIKLSRRSVRHSERDTNMHRGITEVLHINFDNTFISLILDRSLRRETRIAWKDPRTKGIDQNQLYQGYSTYEQRRSPNGVDGFPTCWETKRVLDDDSFWKLEFRSGTYILCNALSKEITKAVKNPFGKNGKPMPHPWDKDSGVKGTARCVHRLSFMPGPCDIGQSASIIIFSHSALLRSLTDTVERMTPLPRYITRLIVEFAFLGDRAPRF